MCGIVGFALKKNTGFFKKDQDLLQDLLFADTIRGDDATGLISIERDASFGIMKTAMPAYWAIPDFKKDQIWMDLLSAGKAVIGHNRKATVGKVNDDTSHPFVVGNTFAMVHNGTLYNHEKLANTEVDSEALAIHLSKFLNKDFDKDIFAEAMDEVWGAYAVAAFNQDTNTIYLMRNSQRPLCLIETPDMYLWGSEYGMLAWCASRNSIDMSKASVEMVAEETLYRIDLSTGTLKKDKYETKKTHVTSNNTQHGSTATTVTKPAVRLTPTTQTTEVLSKNQLKRIKRRFEWSSVQWWGEDYIEVNYPKTVEEHGETALFVSGTLVDDDGLTTPYSIRAAINLKDFPSLNVKNFPDVLFNGRIYELEFDKTRNMIVMYIDRVTLVGVPNKKDINETAANLVTVH